MQNKKLHCLDKTAQWSFYVYIERYTDVIV